MKAIKKQTRMMQNSKSSTIIPARWVTELQEFGKGAEGNTKQIQELAAPACPNNLKNPYKNVCHVKVVIYILLSDNISWFHSYLIKIIFGHRKEAEIIGTKLLVAKALSGVAQVIFTLCVYVLFWFLKFWQWGCIILLKFF